MSNCGIYIIKSKLKPHRIYIGSAIDMKKRFIRHKTQIKNNKHNNKIMQNHFNKYGLEDIDFNVLCSCEKHELLKYEQFYLDSYKPYFNILFVAYSLQGFRHSEYTKNHISRINSGRKMTHEQIRKGVVARIGQKTSLGCKRTDVVKKHLSELRKRRVINTITGEIFDCIDSASKHLGLKYSTFYAKISHRNFNDTNMEML